MSSESNNAYPRIGDIEETVVYEVQFKRKSGTWGVWSTREREHIAGIEIAELRKEAQFPLRKVRVTTKREVVG